MPLVELLTEINAPIQICFDLSRSVELHEESTSHTNEKAISGRVKGLFEKGDTVTWRAKHFGIYQYLSVRISEMKRPFFFEDRMDRGAFKSIWHKHYFIEQEGITIMKDQFHYEVPYGIIGKVFDILVLKGYMRKLLIKRNDTIKHIAENGNYIHLFNHKD
jgi:ligand-binding SRPBCC domain-containing protein